MRDNTVVVHCFTKAGMLFMLFFILQGCLTGLPVYAQEVLKWQQCVSEALQARPDLAAAEASLHQAEAQKKITASVERPQVNASLSGKRSDSTQEKLDSNSTFSYGVSASQLLYDGGVTGSKVDASKETLNAEEQAFRLVSSEARLSLRRAFVELLKTQKLVVLAKEIEERRRENVEFLKLRYEAGREHIGSLRRSEADLAEAEFEVAQAERGVVLAQSQLSSALGRDERSALIAEGSFAVEGFSEKAPDFTTLAKGHPEVLQFEASTRAARYEHEASKKSFSPELSLNSSFGRSSFENWPPDELDWSAGFELSLPLYTGGGTEAAAAKALGAVNEQISKSRGVYLEVLDTLEERWKNVRDAAENLKVQEKYLESANLRSTIANAQYSNGLISFDDWVIIEDNLVSSKKSHLDAQAQLFVVRAEWAQAKGVGLNE